MSSRVRWALILTGFSLLLALVMQGPQWLHSASPLYRGIPVNLNSDEAIYLARVEEGLSNGVAGVDEPFTGTADLVGTQFAFIERLYGRLFAWTGWNAESVLTLMDSVEPVLVFLSLVLFFRMCGFRMGLAFAAAAAFCILELYNLNRPVHMRASFLPMLWALIGVIAAWKPSIGKRSKWCGVLIGGGLLGFLVSIYVWSFLFAWTFFGVLLLWEFFGWIFRVWREYLRLKHSRLRRMFHTARSLFWHTRPRRPTLPSTPLHFLLLTGIIAVIAALPGIAQHVTLAAHPLYALGTFRSGMQPGHLPESIPYSVLFAVMVISVGMALLTSRQRMQAYTPAVVAIIAAFLYMNQQMVHGVVFNFVSHGIFSLATAALCAILLFAALRIRWLAVGTAAAIVYLAAIGYDGRYVMAQWTVKETRFTQQHLSGALEVLDTLPRARILSDADTSALIAGYTRHDIVYSIYLKNILMTNEEIAERLCLTLLPLAPEARHIDQMDHLVFPDATAAFGGDLRQREEDLVYRACAEIESDPTTALRTYGVDYILWDTIGKPLWDVERIPVKRTETASGDGWVLYRIAQ